MSNINPIKFGVSGNQYYKQEKQEDLKNNNSKEQKTGGKQNTQLQSGEILGFMAAQNADIIPVQSKKTLEVSKYVNEEQEARIADFMKGFEADYDEAFNIASNEFPDISEQAAGDLALAYIDSSYTV